MNLTEYRGESYDGVGQMAVFPQEFSVGISNFRGTVESKAI